MDIITKLELHWRHMKVSLTDVGLEAASLVPGPPGSGEHKASHVPSMWHSVALRHSDSQGTNPLTFCRQGYTTISSILPGDDGIAEIYIKLLFSLSNVNISSVDKSDPRPQQRISGGAASGY